MYLSKILNHLLNGIGREQYVSPRHPRSPEGKEREGEEMIKVEDGRKIKRIYYGRNGEYMQEAQEKDGYIKEIILSTEDHGEYDLEWAVVYENGKETSRHNFKFVETVEWEKQS